jgi:hypothetical protein
MHAAANGDLLDYVDRNLGDLLCNSVATVPIELRPTQTPMTAMQTLHSTSIYSLRPIFENRMVS